MKREDCLARLGESWDVLVIGGGATGLWSAVDAASRGLRTLLLEQSDFAKATSSRSTKLIHGGVRYLRQGNVALVRDALRERGLLLRNAPEIVHPLAFIIPCRRWWEPAFYGVGLKIYDRLAGQLGIEPSWVLSRDETLRALPGLAPDGIRGGVLYHDAQFDDARLAVALVRTLSRLGGAALNYMRVTGLLQPRGVRAIDEESQREHEIRARVVINATGVFTDAIRCLDEPGCPPMLSPSQGIHLVLGREFLPGDTAIMVPRTDDGRVLFAIPWHGRVLLGTTDTPVAEAAMEPRPFNSEMDYLLDHAARIFSRKPTRADVRSMFAGLRPLVKNGVGTKTSRLSRDHVIAISKNGLVTITGGKWTTARSMGEDAVNAALKVAELESRPSGTAGLRLDVSAAPALDGAGITQAVREEMARTVEDVLARRSRLLFLDAAAAIEAAPGVASLLARELGRDAAWEQGQITSFTTLARGYLPVT